MTIQAEYMKGTKPSTRAEADRAYVWLPGLCLTFPRRLFWQMDKLAKAVNELAGSDIIIC